MLENETFDKKIEVALMFIVDSTDGLRSFAGIMISSLETRDTKESI